MTAVASFSFNGWHSKNTHCQPLSGFVCRCFDGVNFDDIQGFKIGRLGRLFATNNTPSIAQTRMDKGFEYPDYSVLDFLRPRPLSGFATVAVRCTASLFRAEKFFWFALAFKQLSRPC